MNVNINININMNMNKDTDKDTYSVQYVNYFTFGLAFKLTFSGSFKSLKV